MEGTNRTVRLLRGLSLALLIAVLVPPVAAAAKPRTIKVAWGTNLPELTYGSSVAISPTGVPWFGASDTSGPLLAHVDSGQLSVDYLHGEKRTHRTTKTTALQFDSEGNLWFVESDGDKAAITRRAPDGTLTEFSSPGDVSNSLAIGPGGEVWFARDRKRRPQVGFITPTGAMAQFRLPSGTSVSSLVTGPDGAIWFVDEPSGEIGRITSSGKRRLFRLGRGVRPRQIVAGPDGSLWFSENARRGRNGEWSDRIGRITTSGKVTQFPIPFGHRTETLAADRRGAIWFSTDEGELSSISTSGSVGAHGCIHYSCRKPIVSLAVAPDGSLWFAAAHVPETCLECGGGTAIILANMGAAIGQIPAGALSSGRARRIEGVWTRTLEERHRGTSVAIGPEGIAWFGVSAQEETDLGHVASGQLSVQKLTEAEGWGSTESLLFDPQGNLWFTRSNEDGASIDRRAPDGTIADFRLPGPQPARSLAIGADGNLWFARAGYPSRSSAVGWMTPTGAVTEFPLASGTDPSSIVVAPDGSAWLTEPGTGQIGRATATGELQQLPPGTEVTPHQIVVGPDGALWFSENGEPGPDRTSNDRLGRITTNGEVTQFPIPFGGETGALAVDPRGFVWFATGAREISSIAPDGTLGGRGCLESCETRIKSITATPGGAVWFTLGTLDCSGCGGGAVLMAQNTGTTVGRIPPGALRPAAEQ